jgi:hypothetical protein
MVTDMFTMEPLGTTWVKFKDLKETLVRRAHRAQQVQLVQLVRRACKECRATLEQQDHKAFRVRLVIPAHKATLVQLVLRAHKAMLEPLDPKAILVQQDHKAFKGPQAPLASQEIRAIQVPWVTQEQLAPPDHKA